MVVCDARVDDRVLARSGGVQLPAHGVEDLGDLLRRVAVRALEEQVLDEVRDARALVPLVARPGADPEPERDRPDVRQSLGDDPLAGIELGGTYFCTDGSYSGVPARPAIGVSTRIQALKGRKTSTDSRESRMSAVAVDTVVEEIELWELHSELVLVSPEVCRRALELLPGAIPTPFSSASKSDRAHDRGV